MIVGGWYDSVGNVTAGRKMKMLSYNRAIDQERRRMKGGLR